MSPARGQDFTLAAELPAAVPVSEPQSNRFGIGGMPALGVYLEPAPGLLTGLRARGGALTDGDEMDPALADPGAGGLVSGALAVRVQPGKWVGAPRLGAFLEAAGGLGVTGDDIRPTYEVALGWRFELGRISAGPSARYLYVHQVSDALDDRSAHLALIGLDIGLAAPRARIKRAPTPEPRRPRRPVRFPIEADRDRIVDTLDSCPVVAPQQDEGCSLPDDLVVEGDRIILDDRVLFDKDRARVKHRAWPLIRQLVAAWHAHPEWHSIKLEGHADIRGPEDYNQYLSDKRARRVREKLVEYGMPAGAITAEGFGERRPRTERTTLEAHQLNRRVEFIITTKPYPRPGADADATVPGPQRLPAAPMSEEE